MLFSNKMVSFKSIVILTMLVVLFPSIAKGFDDWNWTTFNEHVCDEVECGKGSCVANSSNPFSFICECQAGWKRTRLDNEDDYKYLPCVIPSCSVQYSCIPAPSPLPSVPHNLSFFDPCYWAYCGGGTCTKAKNYTQICQCDPGYYNLMNVTVFPCFNDCAIGSDCSKLGIKVSSATATPGSSDGSSHANMFLPGKLVWMAIFTASLALVLRH